MIDLNEKTAKALYVLTRAIGTCPKSAYEAAKQFIDEYEQEQHERRHEAQAVPVNWSIEKYNAYHALTEAIFKRETLTTIQKAAITFADICNREERRKPKTSDFYQDIFGNIYLIFGVHDSSTDGEQVKEPIVVMTKVDDIAPFSVSLEDFMNPTFKKVRPTCLNNRR